MSVKSKVLSAGVLFFLGGQMMLAQKAKNDTVQKEKEIEAVVVVGFGQKKAVKEVTGAVSTMKSESIKELPVASVDKAFMGRVTGVQTGSSSGQPGSATSVRVRGISSVNGGVSPVYVIDGVRISSGDLTRNSSTANILANLNNEDIESVTVLKDAVSTALYGADSGSGVIVITTKSGRSGKARFSFSNNFGINSRAVEGPRAIQAAAMKALAVEALYNGRNALGVPNFTRDDFEFNVFNPNGQDFFGMASYAHNDTDWRKHIERGSAFQSDLNFTVSGGSDRMKYYGSLGYFTQEGVIKNSDFSRITSNTRLEYKATDRLTINTDFNFSTSKMKSLPVGGYYSNPILAQYFISPLDFPYNPDGTINLGVDGSVQVSGLQNPVANLENNYRQAITNRVFGNLQVGYKVLKGLNYRFVFAPEFINIDEDDYLSPIHGDGYNSRGALTSSALRRFNFNVQNILEYSFKVGDKNDIVARLIQEAYKSDSRYIAASGQSVALASLYTLDSFVKPVSAGGNRAVSSRAGYAAQLGYNFDKILTVDLAYRRDAISNFLPGQKSGDFWSAGVGFDIARFEFFRDQNILTQFKLRSSYGKLGNQIASSPYATYQYRINYDNNPGLSYLGVFNPRLQWEVVKPFNAGVDVAFFKDRLRLTAEYYNKKTEKLVFAIPLSISQGQSSYDDNVGALQNAGFEFSLSADIFRGDRNQFALSFNANLSTLDNKMLEIYGGNPITSASSIITKGEAVNAWYLRKWAGVRESDGAPLWYINGRDGATTDKYAEAQQAIQGTRFNTLFGGGGLTMSYKGFSLSAQMEYGFGSRIYDNWANYLQSDGAYNLAGYAGYDTQSDYWTPTNTKAANPKPIYGGNKNSNSLSTRFLYKGDYLRLSSAKLGYKFDPSFIKDTKLTGMEIYVMANNYWTYTFDKRFKFDPASAVDGTTNLNLPVMKSLIFGMSFNF